MRFIHDTRGFSLVEVLIATLILTVGLTGVAAMQITSMNGTFFANSQATGSATALAWSEWINGLVSHEDQQKPAYDLVVDGVTKKKFFRENYISFINLDDDPYDSYNAATYAPNAKPTPHLAPFVQVELPNDIDDIVDCFNGDKNFETSAGDSIKLTFRKQGGGKFTAQDMPPPAPAGARLVLRIAANVPVLETATIEVAVMYTNAFINDRGASLRFVIASNM
jgi:prepilin-type N-terminal cleavage/methylation domain-containing protein